MVRVTEFGYIGLHISDPKAWKEFATQVVGMEWLDEGEKDRFYLRLDDWHHRIVLHADGGDDLAYCGWRVAGPGEFHEMQGQLEQAGIKYRVAGEKEAADRHVLGLLALTDPGGNPIEIFHGPRVEPGLPFYPGRRMHGRFVTGEGGLGHCIIREDDVPAAYDFYTRVLGMRGSVEYKIALPDGGTGEPIFLHCNERDHSLAFNIGPMQKRINHLMLEVSTIDDVGLTHEIARQRQVPIALDFGKHSNDQMLSFYMANPSGWLIEIGAGGRKATHQSEYYVSDVWGHGIETTGFGLDLPLRR